jgi:hypothetical protein
LADRGLPAHLPLTVGAFVTLVVAIVKELGCSLGLAHVRCQPRGRTIDQMRSCVRGPQQ